MCFVTLLQHLLTNVFLKGKVINDSQSASNGWHLPGLCHVTANFGYLRFSRIQSLKVRPLSIKPLGWTPTIISKHFLL